MSGWIQAAMQQNTIFVERLRDDLSFCRVYLSFITFGCTANQTQVRLNMAGLWLFEGRQKKGLYLLAHLKR